jgi:acyl-CoA synthetase (AMP-forming)/AMP-acid ligase II
LTLDAPERECLRLLYPDRDDLVLSRAAFFQAARKAASRLAEIGAAPGDLVIIVASDSLPLTAAFFGATLLGAIPSILPFATEKLHPDRYKASMEVLIELAEPAVLVTEPEIEEQVRGLLPGAGEAKLPELLVLRASDLLSTGEPLELDGSFDREAIALLQHSSGTTGLQKGVALSHRAIFEQLDSYRAALDFSPEDVVVSWLPLYHDMGLIAGFLMPILEGARLVLMSPLDWVRAPYMLMRAISEHKGTMCWLPNFAYNFCAQKIREEDLEGVDLSSIRAFVNCSEPTYASSHSLFAERFAPYNVNEDMLQVCYAMAETVFAVSQTEIGQPVRVDAVDRQALNSERVARPSESDSQSIQQVLSAGFPIEGMEVQVFDKQRQPLPERHVGELAVRTSYMLTEYHRRPDATEDAFHGTWYLTGDMGYLAEGEVFVLGRKKDLIIVGGRNVYPRDLETLVNTVEGVHPGRVVAFGIPNPQRGTEDVGIVAEVEGQDKEDHKAVSAAVRRIVAQGTDVSVRYVELVPRGWLVKTSSGKVARAANREKFLQSRNLPLAT